MISASMLREFVREARRYKIAPIVCKDCGREFYATGDVTEAPEELHCYHHIVTDLAVKFISAAEEKLN